ncbi:MAG: M23 family metallopeptidase [Treponema sp.]|jgi:murein DD-endopeptidase MepM/ murein hydrolase activator NlpD|nr:M23 family metallopeptidase [Treponema sp.]
MKRVLFGRLPGILYVLCFYFVLANSVNAQTVPFRYALIPENPRPGEPVTVAVSAGSNARSAVLMMGGQRLTRAAFFFVPADGEAQSFMTAVLAVPATTRPGRAQINIESAAGIIGEIVLHIAEREFVSETIDLNETLSSIRADPDPQKTAESEYLWAILTRTGVDIYSFGTFSPPVTSTRRTSFFGDRRVFRYANGRTDTSIHAGVDYGVPKGTPVSACASGKVVLARFRIVTGNSVIIEHLPGVYSLYYHLDKIDVAEGVMVSAGTILGLSGATGLATGPHLHWEIRVSGENADPDAFISRPVLDKDAILGKISN